MGPSKPPTTLEREWMARVADHGCVACKQDGHDSPASVHHITSGFRRMGHLFTLPLCPAHHQGDGREVPSVHFSKRAFVQRYGSELELLAALKVALGVFDKNEVNV